MSTAASARSIVVDILRGLGGGPLSVNQIIAAASILGYNSATIRVALSRLVKMGGIESSRRAHYRLTKSADERRRYYERWRNGDKQLRRWKGGFVACFLPPNPARRDRRVSARTLEEFGFRLVERRLLLRPDNLRMAVAQLRSTLHLLGLEKEALVFVARAFDSSGDFPSWERFWPEQPHAEKYKRLLTEITEQLPLVHGQSAPAVLRRSFELGARVIAALSSDPLLPEEIRCGDDRRRLTENMLQYEQAARSSWLAALSSQDGQYCGSPRTV